MTRRRKFKFTLYVAGEAPYSAQAIVNLRELCREHAPKAHEIEIVDVLRDPKRALADGIMLTPTVIRLAPRPVRKVVGSLSQRETVVQVLGLMPRL